MLKKIKIFLLDVRSEFKKVTWPTKDHTIKQTGVILAIATITGVFLGVVDFGLSKLVKLLIG